MSDFTDKPKGIGIGDKLPTTPSDDEGLREEIADICRTGHHGIAETKVVNSLMALISQKITEAEVRGVESAKSRVLRHTETPKDARNPTRDYVVVLGEEIRSYTPLQDLRNSLTTK